MKSIRIPDIDLAVTDQGAGVTTVLVHAFPLDRSMWENQIEPIAAQGRVIAPDLRGFGKSGRAKGLTTVQQHADDLAAMLDALDIREPIVLAGSSMGGYIAFEFWSRHRRRLRALVLCDTRAATDSPEAAATRLQTADRVEREGLQVLADSMLPRMFSPATFESRPELVEQMRRTILSGDPAGVAATARGLAERTDFTSRLPEIDCPTLLVVGKDDVFSTPAEMGGMARSIPNSRLVEIEAAGHLAPLERPVEVNRAIVEFLGALDC